MSIGLGNGVSTSQKRTAGGGGTVTGADNGLTLVGTDVYLGGTLIQNTSIDTTAFNDFRIFEGSIDYLLLDPVNKIASLGGINDTSVIQNDLFNGEIELGDLNILANGTRLKVDDPQQMIVTEYNGGRTMYLDWANKLFQLGDIDAGANNMYFEINDAAQRTSVYQSTSEFLRIDTITEEYFFGSYQRNNQTALLINDSVSQAQIGSNGYSMLFLDYANGIYQLGPSAGGINSTYLQVDDANQTLQFYTGGFIDGLNVDTAGGIYQFGKLTLPDFYLNIDPSGMLMEIIESAVPNGLSINNNSFLYRIGDFDGRSNFSYIEINDILNEIYCRNAQLITPGGTFPLISTDIALTNNAGANVGTLTNAPAAGNPTKWIKISDGGTPRYIPAW